MKKLLTWLDNNILKLFLVLYVFFIPLFPKLPFKMVDYTYIAIRFEDFLVAIIYIIFVVQVFRKKVDINKKYLLLFSIFWLSVFISYFLGFFVQKTIVIHNLGLLHSLRRVEYMFIFFAFAATVKSRKDFYFYLRTILVVLAIVTVYGLGQKYAGWPAVQTMNPEYAKGYILVLDSWARISSTFGGHYDLAAYLIFFMPVILAFTIKESPWYYILYLLALSNLVLTASRVSYGAYLMSVFPFLLINRKWTLTLVTIAATVGLTLLSGNLTQRINRTFQTKQIFINKTTGQTTVPRRLSPDDLPTGDFIPNKKNIEDSATDVYTDGNTSINLSSKDVLEAKYNIREQIQEEAKKTGKILTQAEEDALVEATFRNMKVVSASIPDISVATRLQVEWPRAIRAFTKHPLFGSGPSSITEATDGDYFRWLGELGLVGTLSFLTILGTLFVSIFVSARKKNVNSIILWGILAGFMGLLTNATFIDVFEASKVAFIFWMTMGLTVGYLAVHNNEVAVEPAHAKKKVMQPLKKKVKK